MVVKDIKRIWTGTVKTVRRDVGRAMRAKGDQPVCGSMLSVLLTELETGVLSYDDPAAGADFDDRSIT